MIPLCQAKGRWICCLSGGDIPALIPGLSLPAQNHPFNVAGRQGRQLQEPTWFEGRLQLYLSIRQISLRVHKSDIYISKRTRSVVGCWLLEVQSSCPLPSITQLNAPLGPQLSQIGLMTSSRSLLACKGRDDRPWRVERAVLSS